jgi:hypothetical protein
MTTTEKLNAIAAKCRANLALAENRTPGEWEADVFNLKSEGRYMGHLSCAGAWAFPSKDNAAYIAACAGAAEAGWRTTLAAIESVPLVNRGASPSLTQREEQLIADIITAWEGLL